SIRLWRFAVHDVVEFDDSGLAVSCAADVVTDPYEDQRSAATGLFGHVGDRGCAADFVADAQRLAKIELAGRPHTPRQWNRWQEGSALGVAVSANLRFSIQREEVQPVPQRWQRSPRNGSLRQIVERRGECCEGRRRDNVVRRFRSADPIAQMGLHCSHWTMCTGQVLLPRYRLRPIRMIPAPGLAPPSMPQGRPRAHRARGLIRSACYFPRDKVAISLSLPLLWGPARTRMSGGSSGFFW